MDESERAVALGPSDPAAWDTLVEALIYTGRSERAIRIVDETVGLDPNQPGEKLFLKGLAYYSMNDAGKALPFVRRARRHNPEKRRYAAVEAAILAELGRAEEARAALQVYLSGWATYTSLDWIMMRWPFQDPDVARRLAGGIARAGLPGFEKLHYLVAERDRLDDEEIRTLVSGKTMIGLDRGPGGLEDEFEVTRDAAAQIVEQSFLTYFRPGETRIENDLLCDPWWQYEEFCVAVYRNRLGSREERSEYVFFTLYGMFTFSVFAPGSTS